MTNTRDQAKAPVVTVGRSCVETVRIMSRTLFGMALLGLIPLVADGGHRPVAPKGIDAVVTVAAYDEDGRFLRAGSGFFLSEAGSVVTSRHVLFGAASARIKTSRGAVCPVTHVFAQDREAGLLMVAADAPTIGPAHIAVSPRPPEPGQRVVILGSPLLGSAPATEAVISAITDVPGYGRCAQISAPLSPGASGSPVVNSDGELVGVAQFGLLASAKRHFAVTAERVSDMTREAPRTIAQWTADEEGRQRSSAEGQCDLGSLRFVQQDYENALLCFRRAADIRPDDFVAPFYVGASLNKLGRHAEACQALERALALRPGDAETSFALGMTHAFALGRLEEGARAFERVVRINPRRADAHCVLGGIYGTLGRYEQSATSLQKAVSIRPEYADAHHLLGLAHLALGERDLALAELKILLRLDEHLADKLLQRIAK